MWNTIKRQSLQIAGMDEGEFSWRRPYLQQEHRRILPQTSEILNHTDTRLSSNTQDYNYALKIPKINEIIPNNVLLYS